jgi:hypothetical protein
MSQGGLVRAFMSRRIHFTFVVSALALSYATGCIPMSIQRGADLSKLDEFKIEKNRTTEKELVDHFGAPGNTMTASDGSKVLTWSDARSQSTINIFFPQPSGKVTRRSLTATVRDNLVVDYQISDGKQEL